MHFIQLRCTPIAGLDFAYIEASDLTLGLKDFYNQASTVHLPLTFAATERCGVRLEAGGSLFIDESALTFKNFNVATPEGTYIAFDGLLGMGDMASDPSLPLALRAARPQSCRHAADVSAVCPLLHGFADGRKYRSDCGCSGTMGDISLDTLGLRLTRCASLSASGRIKRCHAADRMNGNIALRGRIININKIKTAFCGSDGKNASRTSDGIGGNVAMAVAVCVEV